MQVGTRALPSIGLALAAAVLVLVPVCVASAQSFETPSSPPNVIVVRGTEHLFWNQVGNVTTLRFRAYVDQGPVALDAATCDLSTPQTTCTAPLPPLDDGTHAITLTAVSTLNGMESEPSVAITVEKVSDTAPIEGSAITGSAARSSAPRGTTLVKTSDGLAFVVDIVAHGLNAPSQLAWAPDGRLFVAEADARVLIVRPDESDRGEPALALDARALLDPPPGGALGIALHPDFQRNHFVYVSFLEQDRSRRTLLRIVRLREVGDTLGEPATLFEARLTAAGASGESQVSSGADSLGGGNNAGPRLAFGPDRLLYVALPSGVEFDNEPAASEPIASMLRLGDDGRVPAGVGPLSGMTSHPIGFDWHPFTGAMWAVFAGEGPDTGQLLLRQITAGRASGVAETDHAAVQVTRGDRLSAGALLFQRADGRERRPARAFVGVAGSEALAVVSLADPNRGENLLSETVSGVVDVVAGSEGTLFLATRNNGPASGGDPGGLIVRLAPLRY